MFYLTMHSTHFIYGYMASDIWLRTILIVWKETRCRYIGYSFWLTARVLLYAPSHRQDSTYHGLCYTSRGALAGTRNSSISSPHEGSIRRPIAPWANALTTELHPAPHCTIPIKRYPHPYCSELPVTNRNVSDFSWKGRSCQRATRTSRQHAGSQTTEQSQDWQNGDRSTEPREENRQNRTSSSKSREVCFPIVGHLWISSL